MSQELLVTNGGALSVASAALFAQYADDGLQDVTSEDTALPYLILLQKGSPQLESDNADYNDEARPGMFINTVTAEVFKELLLVPCAFAFRVIERTPREQGNAFIARYHREEAEAFAWSPGPKGEHVRDDNGNWLIDTAYHYVLQLTEDGIPSPAVMALKSTGLKKSKQWTAKMKALKLKSEGRIFTPPSYSSVYKVTSGKETNKRGESWQGLVIERLHYIEDDSLLTVAADFAAHAVEKKLAEDVEVAPVEKAVEHDEF